MEIRQVIKKVIIVAIIMTCVIGVMEYANNNMKREQSTIQNEEIIESK